MRLFIAVEIGEEARRLCRETIAELAATGCDFKWVEPENLHLTLAFLGRTPEARLPEIEALMRASASGGPFELAVGGLGAFGSVERPTIVWLAARAGSERLQALAGSLEQGLAAAGMASPDAGRPFHPHLTLGRMRSPRGLARLTAQLKARGAGPAAEARSTVDRIVLLESRLSSAGSSYREVFATRLS